MSNCTEINTRYTNVCVRVLTRCAVPQLYKVKSKSSHYFIKIENTEENEMVPLPHTKPPMASHFSRTLAHLQWPPMPCTLPMRAHLTPGTLPSSWFCNMANILTQAFTLTACSLPEALPSQTAWFHPSRPLGSCERGHQLPLF